MIVAAAGFGAGDARCWPCVPSLGLAFPVGDADGLRQHRLHDRVDRHRAGAGRPGDAGPGAGAAGHRVPGQHAHRRPDRRRHLRGVRGPGRAAWSAAWPVWPRPGGACWPGGGRWPTVASSRPTPSTRPSSSRPSADGHHPRRPRFQLESGRRYPLAVTEHQEIVASQPPDHWDKPPMDWGFVWRPGWIFSHVFVTACVVTFILCAFWQLSRLSAPQGRQRAHPVPGDLRAGAAELADRGRRRARRVGADLLSHASPSPATTTPTTRC